MEIKCEFCETTFIVKGIDVTTTINENEIDVQIICPTKGCGEDVCFYLIKNEDLILNE